MTRIFLFTVFSTVMLLDAADAAAQATLVESINRTGDELVIPFRKYVLPNGLTVILTEDHSDPLVHVDVTYHVGSAREEIGKSGFAHFFEHMMFEGSEHVGRGEHFKTVLAAGGTMNGTTDLDKTHYFETVPGNQLEKVLWLESDRMGFLLNAVTQQKFENQRSTVKNERGQNYDNRAYGTLQEVASKATFPYGHPYSWLTIGYVEDLNRVDVNDLKRFFLRWYGPNNATLTIGGDIDPQKTLAWVEKYFGPIPRGPEVTDMTYPAPVLTADRYVSYTDRYARLPYLYVSYPGVKAYAKDMEALDALCSIIGDGKGSMLYQAFVKSGKATRASMESGNNELAGTINIGIVATPRQSLPALKAQWDSVLNAFERQGVTDEDLDRYKASSEASFIHEMESVSGKVELLAQSQVFTGDPNNLPAALAAIRAVKKEDVMRVYHDYIKGKPAVIVSVLPKGASVEPAGADNYSVDTAHYRAPDYGYAGLTYHRPVDTFDRSIQPPAGPNPVVRVPDFWTTTTHNGIRMIGTYTNEVPVVTIQLDIKGGGLWAEKDSTKKGLASIVGSMLNEGTAHYTAEQMSEALDKLGSTVMVYATANSIRFTINSLTRNLDATLALFRERLFHPEFNQEAFNRIKSMALQGFQTRRTEASSVAGTLFNKLIYAPGSVLPNALTGTEVSVSGLTLADVKNYYNDYFAPNVSSVEVVGDVREKVIREKLGFLDTWQEKSLTLPKVDIAAADPSPKTIYLVDLPGAAQSEVFMGYATGVTYDPVGLSFKLSVMNHPLGGGFDSRLNLDLREDKGWTYGAGSTFSSGEHGGIFMAQTSVRADATDSTVAEMAKDIGNYALHGMTQAELNFTQHSIGQGDALAYETNDAKAEFLGNILRFKLPATFVAEQQRLLSTLTTDELNQLARSYLDMNKMKILVVGDKASVFPGLEKLGYKMVELDASGRPKS